MTGTAIRAVCHKVCRDAKNGIGLAVSSFGWSAGCLNPQRFSKQKDRSNFQDLSALHALRIGDNPRSEHELGRYHLFVNLANGQDCVGTLATQPRK